MLTETKLLSEDITSMRKTEAARAAAALADRPLFAIGGIDLARAGELGPDARVAVGASVLDADDPVGAARALRDLLGAGR